MDKYLGFDKKNAKLNLKKFTFRRFLLDGLKIDIIFNYEIMKYSSKDFLINLNYLFPCPWLTLSVPRDELTRVKKLSKASYNK